MGPDLKKVEMGLQERQACRAHIVRLVTASLGSLRSRK